MKTTQLIIAVLTLCGLIWLGNSNGALPQNTGAPGDLTCGRAPCHNVEPNTGDAQISISFDDNGIEYEPGGVHTISLAISGEQSPKNGFQIVALNAQNENIGAWNLTAPDQMQIIDGIGLPRKYVTHKAAGNMQNSWSLNWEAPAQGMDTITFYASILDANNNNNNSGDAVYTTTITVAPQPPNAITPFPDAPNVKVFPNPTVGNVHIQSTKPMESIQLYNIHGLMMEDYPTHSAQRHLRLHGLAPGLYFIRISGDQFDVVEKLIIK